MLLYILVIIFCAAWSIEGQSQNIVKKSTPSSATPQDFTVTDKINTLNNENKTEDKTPPRMKDGINPFREFESIIDMKLANLLKNNATALDVTIADICSPFNPLVPDFSAPGRRISDVKCQEYIWNIKYENKKKSRILLCENLKKYRNKEGMGRVSGGRSTVPGEFPHMGAIGWKGINGEWQFKCGSSLISPKFVLTAAHCTKASERDTTLADPVPKIIRLGRKNILPFVNAKWTTERFDINITNIISHPNYKSPRKYYDVALMELERAVEFSQFVQPSCLWGHSDINKLGATATLSGWGGLSEGSLKISPELQAAELDIIDSENCAQYLLNWCNRNWCGLKDHQLCAGKLAGGVDACQGDSGGPLQIKILDIETSINIYYIIGVTAFGGGCAQPNQPGIYTRVSSFIDWIENIVWPQ